MTLSELYYRDFVDINNCNFKTDKGECHNYIDGYYNFEFADKQYEKIKILEIGLSYGGSAKLWREWFKNAEIYFIEYDKNLYRCIDGVIIYLGDGYSVDTINHFKDLEFDYIIDDGPHTLESNLFVSKYWIDRLKPNGKIIIEDIQRLEWLEELKKSTEHLTRVVDLRETRFKRSDDIIFEITKRI